jgi:hypothetical protein
MAFSFGLACLQVVSASVRALVFVMASADLALPAAGLDIAIIGAGLSGLCLAVKLRRAGLRSFAIFEKSAGVAGALPGAARGRDGAHRLERGLPELVQDRHRQGHQQLVGLHPAVLAAHAAA